MSHILLCPVQIYAARTYCRKLKRASIDLTVICPYYWNVLNVVQLRSDVTLVEPHVPAIVNFMMTVASEPERTDGHMSVVAGLAGDLCTVFGARVLPLLEVRPLLELLQAARRSRTPRTKALANWATKEMRKLKQHQPHHQPQPQPQPQSHPHPLTSWWVHFLIHKLIKYNLWTNCLLFGLD